MQKRVMEWQARNGIVDATVHHLHLTFLKIRWDLNCVIRLIFLRVNRVLDVAAAAAVVVVAVAAAAAAAQREVVNRILWHRPLAVVHRRDHLLLP